VGKEPVSRIITTLSFLLYQRPSDGHASSGTRQTCVPPAVNFTLDNAISSALSMADVRSLYDVFSRNGQVVIRPDKGVAQEKFYPVEALMRQTPTDFYKWYTAESSATRQITTLRFELDVRWHRKDTFLIPWGQLHYFRMLKQSIWDTFWIAFFLHGGPVPFMISVNHLVWNSAIHRTGYLAAPLIPHFRPAVDAEPVLGTAGRQAIRVLPSQRGLALSTYGPTLPKLKIVASRSCRSNRRHTSNIYGLLN
jgi:hypothetical protein